MPEASDCLYHCVPGSLDERVKGTNLEKPANEANLTDDGNMFQTLGRRRAFEEILDQLESAIASGRLAPGERLPPERELAQQFQVSRTSVREALRILEALGITRVQRGHDHGAELRETPVNALGPLLRFYVVLGYVSLSEIADALVLVQAWAARRIARDQNPEALSKLKALVEEMHDPEIGQDRYREVDAMFHTTIVENCGNPIANFVLDGCTQSLKRLIQGAIETGGEWASLRERLTQEHADIYAALEAGEVDRAESLITTHLEYWTGLAIERSEAAQASTQLD